VAQPAALLRCLLLLALVLRSSAIDSTATLDPSYVTGATGMNFWYDFVNYTTTPSVAWKNRVPGKTTGATITNAPVAGNDPPDTSGTAGGNACSIDYLAGSTTATDMGIFPSFMTQDYLVGTAVSVCSVTRYLIAPTVGSFWRIIQSVDLTNNNCAQLALCSCTAW
jgi:hypothetical protein